MEGEALELEAFVEILVAAGRRREAIAVLESVEGRDALLVLARVHLASGSREGAEAAVGAIEFWRMQNRDDLEGLTLLHRALAELEQRGPARKLDREIRWLVPRRGRRRSERTLESA